MTEEVPDLVGCGVVHRDQRIHTARRNYIRAGNDGGRVVSCGRRKESSSPGTLINATPQGAASIGNSFGLVGNAWNFNLDTKGTGMTTGIWQLICTLSDGSQHSCWIQVK